MLVTIPLHFCFAALQPWAHRLEIPKHIFNFRAPGILRNFFFLLCFFLAVKALIVGQLVSWDYLCPFKLLQSKSMRNLHLWKIRKNSAFDPSNASLLFSTVCTSPEGAKYTPISACSIKAIRLSAFGHMKNYRSQNKKSGNCKLVESQFETLNFNNLLLYYNAFG